MKTVFRLAFMYVAMISLLSCNDENDLLPDSNNSATQSETIEVVKISPDGNSFESIKTEVSILKSQNIDNSESLYALRFKDQTAFEVAILNLEKSEKYTLLEKKSSFRSLKDIFDEAMDWSDKYLDESEASYEAWKQKYGEYLYFPEYKEDYGAYIPVSNQGVASIVNAKGLVVIGDDIKDLRDIQNYADIQKTGQAYYNTNENMSTRAIVTNVDSQTGNDFIGKELDSGWFQDSDNDRKLRFKLGRKSNKQNINPKPATPGLRFGMNLKLEISFRKKTWLGWANYSSETDTNMEFTIDGIKYTYHYYEEGSSSHDWMDSNSLPWGNTGNYLPNGRPVFYTPTIYASFQTKFRAFDGVPFIGWNCTLLQATFFES